jgi:hypothetical protein
MVEFNKIKFCPVTGDNKIHECLDLGLFPLVNNLCETREESLNCKKYPLSLIFFEKSKLTSLGGSVNSDLLFRHYYYKSGINIPYIDHCDSIYDSLMDMVEILPNDLFIDIGGNDGTLLETFRKRNDSIRLLNIDPSQNLSKICKSKGIDVVNEYFTSDLSLNIDSPKVITSTNVFQHLVDINDFAKGVEKLLTEESLWVLEFPYWIHDLETFQFDQIYHEHVYYYTIIPLVKLFEKYNLRISKIVPQKIHGGTLRLYIVKKSSKLISDESVSKYLNQEESYDLNFMIKWGERVLEKLGHYKEIINDYKKNNKKMACYGAAAKGCVFLNCLNLNHNDIEFIIDDTDIKQNKFMPGTGLKIVGREILKNTKIDTIIILTHNFSEYITKKLREEGYEGEIITFLPEIKID